MQIDINTTTYSTKQRILAFFMAFMIFTMTCPELFEGWGIGLIVHAAAANGEIHSTNTDKTSIYLFNGENPTYNIQANADAADSGTSPYTYSGKYTNNNKVTVFDYVSDYELIHGYNNCWQFEQDYVDAFTSFNQALSQSNTSASPLYNSADNITITLEVRWCEYNNPAYYPSRIDVNMWNGSDALRETMTLASSGYDSSRGNYQIYKYTFNKSRISSWSNSRIENLQFVYYRHSTPDKVKYMDNRTGGTSYWIGTGVSGTVGKKPCVLYVCQ